MSRQPGIIATLAIAGLAFGCSKDETPAPPAAKPTPAAAPAPAPTPPPAPTPTAAATPASQPKPHQMEDCPSTVEGAVTKVTDVKEGVELLVTAKDATAEKAIRERAHKQAEMKSPEPPATTHTADGAHGGQVGSCPIVHENTEIAVKDVKGGAKITVKAKKHDDVAALQKTARQRADALAKTTPTKASPTKQTKAPSHHKST